MANRVSVAAGVSETIFCGSASSVTAVPSSSVRSTGKAGTGVGLAVGTGVAVGAAVGVGVGDARGDARRRAALLHAPLRMASERQQDQQDAERRAWGR